MTILGDGNVGIGTSAPQGILDVSNNPGSPGQLLSSTGSALSWIAPPVSSFGAAVLIETNNLNANSPISGANAFVFGNRTPRQLNNTQFNTLGITLLGTAPWTFTIPTAGTYIFKARALYAADRVAGGNNPTALTSKLFLNYTTTPANQNWIQGNSDRSAFLEGTVLIDNLYNYSSELSGIGTVNANAVISLEHLINNAVGGTNPIVIGGVPTNLGTIEIYATLEIQRIA